mmetsp:Transcript_21276/g.38760  ORF Transcript_21276/g.38760 Transcript_21276/m.38760 type:complete len:210 (-) Transcript_21276:31-660(-)
MALSDLGIHPLCETRSCGITLLQQEDELLCQWQRFKDPLAITDLTATCTRQRAGSLKQILNDLPLIRSGDCNLSICEKLFQKCLRRAWKLSPQRRGKDGCSLQLCHLSDDCLQNLLLGKLCLCPDHGSSCINLGVCRLLLHGAESVDGGCNCSGMQRSHMRRGLLGAAALQVLQARYQEDPEKLQEELCAFNVFEIVQRHLRLTLWLKE